MQDAPTVSEHGTDSNGKPYGYFDVWQLYDLEYAREIPCNRAETFFHFLYSRGTGAAILDGHHVTHGFVDFKLFGPIADDAAEDSGKKLTPDEVKGIRSFQGFEYEGRLKTRFRLYRAHVAGCLPEEEERDAFVERLRELKIGGSTLGMICKVFGLRRVR